MTGSPECPYCHGTGWTKSGGASGMLQQCNRPATPAVVEMRKRHAAAKLHRMRLRGGRDGSW